MARDNKNIQGLGDLEKLLDSLVDDKFRARALRNTAKGVMEPVKAALQEAMPSVIDPNDVVIKTTVNTNKKLKGNLTEKKSSELFSEVTFSMNKGEYGTESAYGIAMILELGRRNPLAKIGKGKTFKIYGKVTKETHRYIGSTEGLYFVKRVRFEQADNMLQNANRILRQEIENEIRKQDKRLNKK
ncbi:hypothetical protein [Aeromonas hydrophila]|uniref:hypothetical protein n=1 Tax=Aeromonas hydrophila TaxID=644 RepID=UPI002362857F|nr:hypothetical protein [Aeromonas hydrophila]